MKKVAIVGTGLVGGSIGLRLRATAPELDVVGTDLATGTAAQALARGALSGVADDPAGAVQGADLVILAMPVTATGAVLTHITPHVAEGAIVTDVGSTKAGVVTAGEGLLGDRFIGGHPMAGSERHGIEAADADLFEDAWWILTPTARTASRAYREVAGVVTRLGAKPIAVEPAIHDALVARLSHLPQLVASAVVTVATAAGEGDPLLGLAAGGFRDVTRIAASNPDLWVAIISSNSRSVLEALSVLESSLGGLRETIEKGRWDELRSFLDDARRARLELFAKAVYTGDPVALTLLIPDRPGVLAEVTTAAGQLGANIEDIQIFHSTEGGRGRLELVVAGRDAAEQLLERLRSLGYHVELGLPE